MIEEELTALKDSYSIIFVTHILRQARGIADYVIFMYYGKSSNTARRTNFSIIQKISGQRINLWFVWIICRLEG